MNKHELKEYRIWKAMKSRCYAPCNKNMGYYQKDNITVCDRWRYSFENFIADMGKIPGENYSIDRIDNLKGYSPENCRWIPFSKQSRNRRNIINITYQNETRPLKEWARLLGLNYFTLFSRIKDGMPFEEAVRLGSTPKRYIEINGKSQYMSDWCKEIGVTPTAIYSWKHKHGATAKEAVLHYMKLKEG